MSFALDGYEILGDFLTPSDLNRIKPELKTVPPTELTAGIRNADKKFSGIGTLVHSHKLLAKASEYLNDKPNLVRVILFDKTPENNWLVSWHQDKTICVSERKEIENWGPWSFKDGIHHVQPPLDVLNQMVTFRIHLDASTLETGCLRIIPKSHLQGILSSKAIQEIANTKHAIDCIGKSGSLLVMKPHLLHASSKATQPSQRRVIHVEYSSYELPYNLKWV